MISETHNTDCMNFMQGLPDGFFDLVIADPPYGIGADKAQGTTRAKPKKWGGGEWDKTPVDKLILQELIRVSKNQIVWGANYFNDSLKSGKKWIAWDKMLDGDQGHFELAWTSFLGAERIFRYPRSRLQGFMNPSRFHPTEKPVALYKWTLTNYAKPGNKIFDPMMGSQSSRIASWDMGFDYWGCEADCQYFSEGEARFKAHAAKPLLFAPEQMYYPEQTKLFT